MHETSVSFPLSPNATRWFGLLRMAETFLKFERIFKICNMESEKMHNVTASDWKKLRGFADVLKPFEMATKTAEGEKYLTLSCIIPMLSILRKKTTAYFKNPAHHGYGKKISWLG